jgi:hypothetical protein
MRNSYNKLSIAISIRSEISNNNTIIGITKAKTIEEKRKKKGKESERKRQKKERGIKE